MVVFLVFVFPTGFCLSHWFLSFPLVFVFLRLFDSGSIEVKALTVTFTSESSPQLPSHTRSTGLAVDIIESLVRAAFCFLHQPRRLQQPTYCSRAKLQAPLRKL
jgi:hypothetical protein